MTPVLRGSNPQRAPSPSQRWTVCHCGKRDASRETGSLPGNLSRSQRNCTGQGKASRTGAEAPPGSEPRGNGQGQRLPKDTKDRSPPGQGMVGMREERKADRERARAAAHTMKVRTFIKGAAEKPRRGRAPQDIKEDSKASTHSDSSRVNKFPLHNKGPAWGSPTGKINTELNESSLKWKQDSP